MRNYVERGLTIHETVPALTYIYIIPTRGIECDDIREKTDGSQIFP